MVWKECGDAVGMYEDEEVVGVYCSQCAKRAKCAKLDCNIS